MHLVWGIPVISLVRRVKQPNLLASLGAEVVLDLSATAGNIAAKIKNVTGNKGVKGIIDNVGGPVTGELIRSSDFGSRLVINGGMSAARGYPKKYRYHSRRETNFSFLKFQFCSLLYNFQLMTRLIFVENNVNL